MENAREYGLDSFARKSEKAVSIRTAKPFQSVALLSSCRAVTSLPCYAATICRSGAARAGSGSAASATSTAGTPTGSVVGTVGSCKSSSAASISSIIASSASTSSS